VKGKLKTVNSNPLKSFDRVAHCYDETRGIPAEAARQIGEGIARIVREVAASPRLIEIGVGTGRMAVPLAEAGVHVTGIDLSPKMLGVLREKRRDIDVILAEASHPPLRTGTFDAALFVHILHLVPDAEATLRATVALVRPGGVVLFGQDQGRIGLRDEADAVIRRAVADLSGVDIASRDAHAEARALTERVLRDIGAEVTATTVASWPERSRGRTMIERLARKDYSSSWQIPDAVLPGVIERVTPELEEMYGGLDREIEWERSFRVVVGRLRGA
jgi:ubiquinone/menaquinone biosynthesis C-methylase UbiE